MVDILVHPIELRNIASQMRESAKKIGQAMQVIDAEIHSLKNDKFLGNRANAVQMHYQSKREALHTAKNLVLHFASDLETAANMFEQADKSGASQSIIGLPLPSLPFGSSFWPAYWNFYEVDKSFLKIMTTFLSGRGDFKEALKILGLGKSYDFFKNGVPYRDAFDLNFRQFNKMGGLLAAGIVVGTLEDLMKGTYENGWKALGVNSLDEVITLGISFNPYARAALLVSGAVQLGGNLTIGLERIRNDFIAADDTTRALLLSQSDIKAASLEKMDLGNITKSFSESICDGFLFTDSGRNDLMNTARSTVNVLDGVTEFAVNTAVSSGSTSIAFIDRFIQDNPLFSDEIKQASSYASHDVLGDVRDFMNGMVNLVEWR